MWFFTAAFAFFLLAVAAVADKFLLSKSRLLPIAYAFYIAVIGGILSGFLLFWEADFYFPRNQLVVLLIGGVAFVRSDHLGAGQGPSLVPRFLSQARRRRAPVRRSSGVRCCVKSEITWRGYRSDTEVILRVQPR